MKTSKNKDNPVNRLVQIEKFKAILSDYRPTNATIDVLLKLNPIFLVGPTASGRNTLIKILEDTNRYHYIISDTTRKPRMNNGVMETNGVEYWFRSEDEFLSGLKNGEYLEAAVIHNQQVSGISLREIISAGESGKVAIDEIEVEGAKTLHEYMDDGLFVFLLPPNFETWMKRLRGRGDIDEQELIRRLVSAEEEVSEALSADFYQFVINDDIHEAAQAVDELASGGGLDEARQELGRRHAGELIESIKNYLSQ